MGVGVRLLLLWGMGGLLAADGPELDRARALYQRAEYRAVLDLLLPLPDKSGPTCALIGKARFMEGEYKNAASWFQQAVAAEPRNSEYHHWLGKAYGRRAETSSFLTAPGFASRTRTEFEKAVELDPRNREAVNDLFEYYLQAPGFLGGGFDKAAALVE
ncbi:MAG: tetratricopeptide repeat protein, partial [Acidobacteriota bacterium]